MTLVDKRLSLALSAQLESDRRTGAVSAEEACSVGIDSLAAHHAVKMTHSEEEEFVALCSLVNILTERANELARKVKGR